MKKTIIIGLVLLAAVVSAKNTVIYENFDRYARLDWRDYWKCESTEGGQWNVAAREGSEKNLYLFYESPLYERHFGSAIYLKNLSLIIGDRYTVELDYKNYCNGGGLTFVHLGRTCVGILTNYTYPWTRFKATVVITETERSQFLVYAEGNGYHLLNIDNIIVEKCGVGIEPNSIGKIKALYK